MMDFTWIILINSIITLIVCGAMYSYFMGLFDMQAELMDKVLIKHQNSLKEDDDNDIDEELQTTLKDYCEEE